MVKMKMMLQTQNLCKYFRKQKAVNNVHLISKRDRFMDCLDRMVLVNLPY